MKLMSSVYRVSALIIWSMFAVSPAVQANTDTLPEQIRTVEADTGARVGVYVLDTSNGTNWQYHGQDRFPLMSTFKTLACAKLLHDADHEGLLLTESVVIKEHDLITWSPVMKKRVGQAVSLTEACAATMLMSDNTAANIVLNAIQGPDALTAFLRQTGDRVTRLDRIEPALNEALPGDERDTTTPEAMVNNLKRLLLGDVLSDAARQQLTDWMKGNKVSDSLLRSVLPNDWDIADRSGDGGSGSRGITAIVWPADKAPLIISIYMTETEVSFKERNAAIAAIGRAIFKAW